MNSLIAFVCYNFSDNTRYHWQLIFTSLSRSMLNLLLFSWILWMHHWISVKILLLSILIMWFGSTEKVFLLMYLYQCLVINYKSLYVDLFFTVKKSQKEELIHLMIASLHKSIFKIDLLRFHQLLQSVNGVVLL